MLLFLCGSCLLIGVGVLARFYYVLPPSRPVRPSAIPGHSGTRKLAVFLGSGGHTSEALKMLSALDFKEYTPRTYFVGQFDDMSVKKAVSLELSKAPHASIDGSTNQYTILEIPRARGVKQTLLAAIPTACHSLLMCIYYVTIAPTISPQHRFADILILNGPGTCLMFCVAVYCNKMFGLPAPSVVYVESFARVTSLSLSGKLLRPLVDRFVVQWPQLLEDGGRGECYGWLV